MDAPKQFAAKEKAISTIHSESGSKPDLKAKTPSRHVDKPAKILPHLIRGSRSNEWAGIQCCATLGVIPRVAQRLVYAPYNPLSGIAVI